MKYIRTKDGRIVKHPHPNAEVFTFRYEILKQADTIEELCDEFIFFYKDSHTGEIKHGYAYKKWIHEDSYKQYIEYGVYGAVWTVKGLIYVAKMNNKGELELI